MSFIMRCIIVLWIPNKEGLLLIIDKMKKKQDFHGELKLSYRTYLLLWPKQKQTNKKTIRRLREATGIHWDWHLEAQNNTHWVSRYLAFCLRASHRWNHAKWLESGYKPRVLVVLGIRKQRLGIPRHLESKRGKPKEKGAEEALWPVSALCQNLWLTSELQMCRADNKKPSWGENSRDFRC